jgi:MFS family permease
MRMASATLGAEVAMTDRRLHYGWVVAGLTFLALLVAAAVRSAPGVLIVPLEREFGWSRATISSAVSVNLVLYGLISPFAAAFLDWLGVRRTMAVSLGVVAAGAALTPLIVQPWHLVVLWGVVVGGGTGMAALVLGATVASRWFDRRRGLVMGLLSASTATGQLLFLPGMAWLAATFGWRATSLAVAAAAVAALVPLGLLPYGATEPPPPPPPRRNPAAAALAVLAEAARHRDFRLLAGGFFVCGLTTNGLIGTHLIPACFDHGIPEVRAAGLLAAMGIFDVIGTTASGWLSDRVDNRLLLFWYYGLRGLSLIFLPFALDLSFYGLSLFALFYGLDWIATVPPTVRLCADCLGRDKAGIVFGWVFAAHQLGAAVAAWTAALVRTELGDYLWAFIGAGIIGVAAGLMSLLIGRTPYCRQGAA